MTGANGYVGSRLRDHLSGRGWAVHSLVRKPRGEASPAVTSIPFTLDEGVDPAKLRGVDVLVHCAYDFGDTRWDEIHRTNVEGSRKLFKAAVEAGVGRIILISTMSAFEGCASMYGRAKLEIERCALENGAAVVRSGLVYGKGAEGMVGALDRFVRVSRITPVFEGGKQTLFLAHQEDLARLVHALCCRSETPRGPIVAACENGIRFREILQTLAKARNRQLLFVPAPWKLAWLLLRSAETVGIRMRLRSDSLVSLLNQNQNPDFAATRRVGVQFRDFRDWTGD